MQYLQNLHQHSTICDGKDTPEQVVLGAIEKKFHSLGFSSHSYPPAGTTRSMNETQAAAYRQEIWSLKEKYKDQLEIYCGLEEEIYAGSDLSEYDYVIGSSHYFKIGEEYVGFDRDAQKVQAVIDRYFGGDGMAYAKAYFAQMARLPEFGTFDIIGHFDQITKHCEKCDFFDTSSPVYRNAAFEAIEALAGKIPYFEVNTGAIARGYRTTPYPMPFIIKEFHRRGFGVVLTSDCHNVAFLDCWFEEAAELLKECGFRERFVLTENGFQPVAL